MLPYGVVAGGFLSDAFLGLDGSDVTLDTSSKRKYASVIGYAGGYKWFQTLLETLRSVGDKHGGASISNVASRWVLDSNAVTPAIILGARNDSAARPTQPMTCCYSLQLTRPTRVAW